MQLETYFDFLASDDIRIQGTRIGIESILYEYVFREQSPEAIADRFPSLTLEQIYATILYYLQHKEEIEAYLSNWLAEGERRRHDQHMEPPPVIVRLRRQQQQETALTE